MAIDKAVWLVAGCVGAVVVVMSFIWWCIHRQARQRRVVDREPVAAREAVHSTYMTVQNRLAMRDSVRRAAFPQPDDSSITMKIGSNHGYTVQNRIGSRSKYASSFKAVTDTGLPFAVRVYAVPRRDRSKIERDGIDAATQLLQQGKTGGMPVVYGCFTSKRCKLAKPYDGPATGVCHIIVNELANMDAEQWMRSHPSLQQVKTVIFQVTQALLTLLKENKKRHGDLKASNVLITLEPSGGYVVYDMEGTRYWMPFHGVRATLWDFEFVKPVDTKENEAAETLDLEKFLREIGHYYTRDPSGRTVKKYDSDSVINHIRWLKDTIHRNHKKKLSYFMSRMFQEYKKSPGEDAMILEHFS